jgi:hypothetical protein
MTNKLINMRPEILQTLTQIVVFVGIILTAIGGYGHFHYGKKIEQKREIVVDSKLDSIPRSINSTSNQNTDKVLGAIKAVKQTVDEIAASDGSNIEEIIYPSSGKFGTNILDRNKTIYKVGIHSMRVEIPKNQEVIVMVSGTKWAFPVYQSIPGWRHFDLETEGSKTIRKFMTLKGGILDLEMMFTGLDEIELSVFENGSKVPSWEKIITVEEK